MLIAKEYEIAKCLHSNEKRQSPSLSLSVIPGTKLELCRIVKYGYFRQAIVAFFC